MLETDAEFMIGAALIGMRTDGLVTDCRPEAILIDAAGCSLYIRQLTAVERVRFCRWGLANGFKDADRCGAAIYCVSVCDERGAMLHDLDDVEEIMLCVGSDTLRAVAFEMRRVNKL